ncbi:MAG: zinc-binding alcohol dehydrogenase family protein [Ardenticatenaceae bacterium]|nr:zinc-binding alcohol dehydrogenase family protein [Ardenticatenaceae bacterium]
MKAAVVFKPGPPEALEIKDWPKPSPRPGWVLIQVKAFGLNRSEMFTRQGHSGDAVPFPRVLGIECVGVVVEAPETDLTAGQTVAALMGGMGREYDGGYAEYTLVPRRQVILLNTSLPWEQLAAIPETFLTAWGSLTQAIGLKSGDSILIRGGTSSVGMAAATIAKSLGATVVATTRNENKRTALLENGADHVVIENYKIADDIQALFPGGVTHVLELVGTVTLLDSFSCTAPGGVVCFTGILGNEWVLKEFSPFEIPSTIKLTTYNSETVNAANSTASLQEAVEAAEEGRYRINLHKIFALDEIVEAHRYMEEGHARGKLVVMVN